MSEDLLPEELLRLEQRWRRAPSAVPVAVVARWKRDATTTLAAPARPRASTWWLCAAALLLGCHVSLSTCWAFAARAEADEFPPARAEGGSPQLTAGSPLLPLLAGESLEKSLPPLTP